MKDITEARPGDTITNGWVDLNVVDIHADNDYTWLTTEGPSFTGFPSSAHQTTQALRAAGFQVVSDG